MVSEDKRSDACNGLRLLVPQLLGESISQLVQQLHVTEETLSLIEEKFCFQTLRIESLKNMAGGRSDHQLCSALPAPGSVASVDPRHSPADTLIGGFLGPSEQSPDPRPLTVARRRCRI